MKAKIYQWIDIFKLLTDKLFEIGEDSNTRDEKLTQFIEDICQNDNCNDILKYPVDPISFIYLVAAKTGQSKLGVPFFKNLSDKLNVEIKGYDETSLWLLPKQYQNILFNDGKTFSVHDLWNIFNKVKKGEPIDKELFKKLLDTKNIGVTKLTHVLFILDPYNYLPIDTSSIFLEFIGMLGLNKTKHKIASNNGIDTYYDYIRRMKEIFTNCECYEINALCYILSRNKLLLTNDYWLINTYIYNDDDNHVNDFYSESMARVGGEYNSSEQHYPVKDVNKGDILLVRSKRKGSGIGIVTENEYKVNGYTDEGKFNLIWINKEEKDDAINPKQAKALCKAIEYKNSFKNKYKKTFEVLEYIMKIDKVKKDFPEIDVIDSVFKYKRQLVLQGPPGTGKTRLAKEYAKYLTSDKDMNNSQYVDIIQFHPSYTYEDFIRGIVAETDKGNITYNVKNKTFMDIINKANNDQHNDYILIIDEINRANLSSVFGELIYALEYRDENVSGVYTCEDSSKISIPNNLYIIGTMNSIDKSVGYIDLAIRRRFAFIDVLSKEEYVSEGFKAIYKEVKEIFTSYKSTGDNIDDIMIGHSYFIYEEDQDINEQISIKLKYEIIPLIKEYIKDGILQNRNNELDEKLKQLEEKYCGKQN